MVERKRKGVGRMTKQCNNCKYWRLGTASLDDNYCNLTGEWSDYEGYCDSWEGYQMTEKYYCGQCVYFTRFYCPKRNKQVSYSGYTCNDFELKGDIE